MTAKTPNKKEAAPVQPSDVSLQVAVQKGEGESEAVARTAAIPAVNAAVTITHYHPLRKLMDVNAVRGAIQSQVQAANSGDMTRAEAMLVAQAHTLDAMFNTMAQIAAKNMDGGYLQATETYMRMALKAQSQCRTTLEALSEIKNPTGPTFVKQQNIAQNQQVNNGQPADSRSSTHARTHEKDVTPSNELLEASNGERLDFGTTGATVGANPHLATVGEVDRAEDGGGEGHGSAKRI